MQHRRPIVANVLWSVCLLVTTVSCAKTAKPIEMSFGMWTRVSPRNSHIYQVEDRIRDHPGEGAILEGISRPNVQYREVGILNLTRYEAAAMRPLATSINLLLR